MQQSLASRSSVKSSWPATRLRRRPLGPGGAGTRTLRPSPCARGAGTSAAGPPTADGSSVRGRNLRERMAAVATHRARCGAGERGSRLSSRVSFGPFHVDLGAGELLRAGRPVTIQRKPFELLAVLIERAGELVTRDELCRRLWPDGTHVDFEHGLRAPRAPEPPGRGAVDLGSRPRAHLTNHSRRRARVFDRLAALRSLRRSSSYGSVARLASRPNPRAGLGPDL
jgi:hypothetical protein